MLDKKGNSNTRERCELWNRFLEIFADRKIDFLTADREFVGEEWFDYLLCDPYTPFRIRIRKNTLLDDGEKELRADVCFQDLQVGVCGFLAVEGSKILVGGTHRNSQPWGQRYFDCLCRWLDWIS
ncbi:hypothetical protein H6F42_04090 [Pseudanabaena sp. FACHB-1998]|uniref:hypothetical protein n=1 Tax=Pseudanabaena sp. FACHB-1998 TaxID=2692858 RepID=UPI001681387A|nr:hypothetical protein [Pseudanabaena sp. FACHB-1998]MBD2176100.1 hypothetical protein [Pseudanabaena sp. FACHB-1998]